MKNIGVFLSAAKNFLQEYTTPSTSGRWSQMLFWEVVELRE